MRRLRCLPWVLLNTSLAVLLLGPVSCAPRVPAGNEPIAAELPDSIAAEDPNTAYRRAMELGRLQEFNKSLPYFRHALATPTPVWQPHCDYAITMFHASFETRELRGRRIPVVRSTYERMALLAESARQLDLAERLTTSAEDRAFVIARRARQWSALGFPWDATLEYERAARLDPRYSELARTQRARVRTPTPEAGLSRPPSPATHEE